MKERIIFVREKIRSKVLTRFWIKRMSFGIFILNIYDVFSMNIKNFKSLLNDDC